MCASLRREPFGAIEAKLQSVQRERFEEEEKFQERETSFDGGRRRFHDRSAPGSKAGVDAALIDDVEDLVAGGGRGGGQETLQPLQAVAEALQKGDAEERVTVAGEEALGDSEESFAPTPLFDVGHEVFQRKTVVEELLQPLAVADRDVVLKSDVDVELSAAHEEERHLGLRNEADAVLRGVLPPSLETFVDASELCQDVARVTEEVRLQIREGEVDVGRLPRSVGVARSVEEWNEAGAHADPELVDDVGENRVGL